MARLQFVPTEDQRKLVKSLAAYGLLQQQIANIIGLRSVKTLRKHLRKELTLGGPEANAKVAQTAYQMAISGKHPSVTMFWLKTRAGWREVQPPETSPASAPAFIISIEKEAA